MAEQDLNRDREFERNKLTTTQNRSPLMNSSSNLTTTIKPINPVRRIKARTLTWLSLPGLLLMYALALVAGTAAAATLTTDKSDYSPGQHVTFTGTGWQPGETVNVEIYETSVDPFFDEGGVTAIADANGNISNSDFACQTSFLGQGFLANASGQSSGSTAQATFTDSVPSDFS